jgi:hypothetical protein
MRATAYEHTPDYDRVKVLLEQLQSYKPSAKQSRKSSDNRNTTVKATPGISPPSQGSTGRMSGLKRGDRAEIAIDLTVTETAVASTSGKSRKKMKYIPDSTPRIVNDESPVRSRRSQRLSLSPIYSPESNAALKSPDTQDIRSSSKKSAKKSSALNVETFTLQVISGPYELKEYLVDPSSTDIKTPGRGKPKTIRATASVSDLPVSLVIGRGDENASNCSIKLPLDEFVSEM